MTRKTEAPILPLFYQRWSPRAMNGQELTENEIKSLLEAARWAPSSYNNQPWRYFYATPRDSFWNDYITLMGDFNRSWASKAGVLFVAVAHTNFEKTGKPSVTAEYDTGAASVSLALQGFSMGLVVHQMEGFDYAKAHALLKLPEDYKVLAMIAAGHPGKIEDLPKDLQEREVPSDRKPLAEIMFHGFYR